ncbi:MAG: dihydrofolate reductase [Candidatus Carbobacillus altaicus]|nr:dihydrofolate reductase [Candidatus Carbobacillus altaicus]
MIFPWTAVVAMDVRGIIAREGKLPWYLPSELQHFKRLTLGHPVIMGRKTFEAIGRPLPNRHNVILSRWKREDAAREIVTAQDATHHYVHDVTVLFDRYGQEEAMVIGGRDIFSLLLPYCTRMVQTIVLADIEGDTYFPPWDRTDWIKIAESSYRWTPGEAYAYVIQMYERKRG